MSHSLAWLFFVSGLRFKSVFCMDGKSKAGVDLFDAATARATNGATVAMSGSGAVLKHVGNQLDVRLYGTEGYILFDPMRGQLELRRQDGRDEIIPIPPGETDYDGARPVRKFAELCAGKPIVNASDGECGARVTEALDALYRSAAVGAPEPVGRLKRRRCPRARADRYRLISACRLPLRLCEWPPPSCLQEQRHDR